MKERSEVVERDLEEVNGCFDHHQGEINCLKIREKEAKEKVEQLEGFVIRAGHDTKIFKNQLDHMEDSGCWCGQTPSEVGEEFVSSKDKGRTKLSYASASASKYVAPLVENPIPLPVPPPCHPRSSSTTAPALEEIVKEPSGAICEDLNALLQEADVERARDLQEGSSNLVVRSSPQVGSDQQRRLNRIHWMHPGPGQRTQRVTCSHPYIRRDSSRCSVELRGLGEPGRRTSSPPSSTLGNLLPDVSWGAEAFPSINFDGNGLAVKGEELVWQCGGELGLWVHDQPED